MKKLHLLHCDVHIFPLLISFTSLVFFTFFFIDFSQLIHSFDPRQDHLKLVNGWLHPIRKNIKINFNYQIDSFKISSPKTQFMYTVDSSSIYYNLIYFHWTWNHYFFVTCNEINGQKLKTILISFLLRQRKTTTKLTSKWMY